MLIKRVELDHDRSVNKVDWIRFFYVNKWTDLDWPVNDPFLTRFKMKRTCKKIYNDYYYI